MTIILNGTTGITTPGITNQGVVEFTAGSVSAPSITTTGDTNTGIYFPAADTIAFTEGGVESMRIDSSGNVGIGTASPAQKVEVSASANSQQWISLRNLNSGSSSSMGVLLGNDTNSAFGAIFCGSTTYSSFGGASSINLGTYSTTPLVLYTNNTERARLDSSGNLGLGVTPSAWDTTASKALQLTGGSIWAYSTSQLNLIQNAFYNTSGNLVYTNTAAASAYRQISGVHSWNVAASGTAGNTISFTQAMTLTADGNLGLGTTSPETFSLSGRHFEVDGRNGDYSFIHNRTTNVRSFYAINDVADLAALFTYTNHPLTFGTNNTERARITAGGTLCVNTTSAIGTSKLTVSHTAGNTIAYFGNGSSGLFISNDSTTPRFTRFSQSGDYSGGFIFSIGNTDVGTFNLSGEFIVGGTTDQGAYNMQCNGTGVWGAGAYVNGSDARLKDNIQSLDSGLDVIKAIRPVTFQYKPEYSKDQSVQPGFIAQELQEAMAGKAYLEGVVQEGTNHLNVAYQNIIPILVKAIQELSAKVTALESK